mmetsp:Transcript_6351/g.15680  ORF Transcript_6351/g.15680 Transcript_6351/m.15680 type:complete len:134 (+) Transcript_6351:2774-3175(+)
MFFLQLPDDVRRMAAYLGPSHPRVPQHVITARSGHFDRLQEQCFSSLAAAAALCAAWMYSLAATAGMSPSVLILHIVECSHISPCSSAPTDLALLRSVLCMTGLLDPLASELSCQAAGRAHICTGFSVGFNRG